ncbi:UDP-N-acetylenolpyruvoylglucosamine reductase [filamentous cyanobacterium CCT1]|nr:UDP-N-acetylenolpyruvoylglucosamine reductase [filamentous cyanobacterium CCT1]PSN79755.1 UDP-N-acetylenolpyruvoylglucosamine reductase [filamentous cyanobacterium CCP4]
MEIRRLESNKLSFYRTRHKFENYAEFSTVEEFISCYQWANKNKANFYILGNGSNTFFSRKKIRTLILKNNLAKRINPINAEEVEVSSSVLVINLLKYCYENSLDSFYYLASVPATIGGALAMNAGRGQEHNLTIYDFVVSVTFFDGSQIRTLKNIEIKRSYRETIFTGMNNLLIISAIFRFPYKEIDEDPIAARRDWSKKFQDYNSPNCGSVFKYGDRKILGKLKGLKMGKANFSSKTFNWINNYSEDSIFILILIKFAQLLHLLLSKEIGLEIIKVD